MNSTTQFERLTPGDSQSIEEQNDQIRADMGETLQALERKLSPGQLVDRALAMVKEHGGEIGANLGRTVKEAPVPALLTVVGIGWLMASQRRIGTAEYGSHAEAAGGSLRDKLEHAREQVGHAGEGVHAVGERIRQSATSLREGARAAAERTRGMVESARQRSGQVRETFSTMLDEQPLALGAIGVALGAIIAAALPSTDRENRLMGEARDRALDRARDEGRRQYEKARETAVHAAHAAKESVSEVIAERRAH